MKIENKELMIAGTIPKSFEVYKNEEDIFFVCMGVSLPDSGKERLLSFREIDKFTNLPSLKVAKNLIKNYAFKSEVVTNKDEWIKGEFNVSKRIIDGKYKLYKRVNFYNALEAFIIKNPESVSENFKRNLVETSGYVNYLYYMRETSFVMFNGRSMLYRSEHYEEIMRCIKLQVNREKTINLLVKNCLNGRPTLDWAQQVFEYGPVKSGRNFNIREYKIPIKTHLKDEIYATNH